MEVTQSERCNLTTTEKSCILEILSSSSEDDGEYTCRVENEAGQDTCQAVVTILGVLLQHFQHTFNVSNVRNLRFQWL